MRIPFLAILTILVLLLGAPGAGAEPLKIRHGWVILINSPSAFLYAKPELLRHYGKSYVEDSLHFNGTSAEVTGIATGEVDLITLAYSSMGTAIQNAHLDDLRVVMDGFQDGVDGYVSSPYIVRNDGIIKTIEDLKGKVMVVNQIGSAVDIGGRAMLRLHHLTAGKDYTVVEAPFPTMAAMLLEKKADIAADTPPFMYDPRLAPGTRTLFSMKESMGPSQMIAIVGRAEFLEKNRAALADYFEDTVRFIHWMLAPENRAAVVALVADLSKQPPDQIDGYFLTKKDVYHDPDGMPNLVALQSNIDTQRDLGFLKDTIDVRKYADVAPIAEAAKRVAIAEGK